MNKIVVFGASVVDVLMKSDKLSIQKPHETEDGVAMAQVIGGKIEADECKVCSGGGGSNVAVGLKKMGESVKLVSRIGSDDLGRLVKKELEGYFLDLSMLQNGKGKTGISNVLINKTGGRAIVTYRGESAKISSKEIDWETIKKADWVQISSLGGRMDLLSDIVDYCFSNGVRVGFNPGKAEIKSNSLKQMLKKIEFLSLNRSEASLLSGIDYDKEKDVLRSLSENGTRILTVTDGKKGASLVRSGRWLKMDTLSNKSVDDTGAGDAFVSGVLSGILSNKTEEEVLKRGIINGSSVVSKIGAKSGLLTNNEFVVMLKKKVKTVEVEL